MRVETAKILKEAKGWCGGKDEEGLTGAETILYVEDESFVRDVTCEVLRAAGYRVLTAKNAVEAVRLYEAHRGEVNLLLTDMILPGETGSTLARRLRLEDPGLKVLLVTGYADQLGRLEAKQQECLGKPFSSGMLLGRVRRLLDVDGVPIGTRDLLMHACGNASPGGSVLESVKEVRG